MAATQAGISNGYRYSYSGSDARVYAYFPGRADKIVQIESLHTISWSVHEAKGQARSLGHKGVRGFSRGIRVVAGSIITTVIEDNPLAPVMDMMAEIYLDPALRWEGWSMDWKDVGVGSGLDLTTFNRRLAPTLPPLNLFIQYVAEGSQWVVDPSSNLDAGGITSIPGAAALLIGAEFMTEGQVTSTQDSATEVSYSFVAMDCKPLSAQTFDQSLVSSFQEDPAFARAGELQRMITGNYRDKAELYKEQNNLFDDTAVGFGPGINSGLA